MSVFLAFGEQAHNCLLILFRSHTHTHPPSNFIHSLVCFAEMQNDVIANFICGFFVSTINVGGFVAIPMLRVRFIFCSPMILAYEFVSFNWIVVLYPFSRFFSFDFPLDAALFRRQSICCASDENPIRRAGIHFHGTMFNAPNSAVILVSSKCRDFEVNLSLKHYTYRRTHTHTE